MIKSTNFAFVSLVASALVGSGAEAQDPEVRVRSFERPSVMAYSMVSANRAVIGVSLSVGAPGDTLGLEVTAVTADGPAAKAGITVGSRLQQINGVSLRISADDAADPLTADAGYRRLQRELGKAKAGDELSLRVLSGGQSRTVNVTTVSADELDGGLTVRRGAPVAFARGSMSNRSALGLSIQSAGNARDTLGVFVTSVVSDGPADKAGIIEGQRIAAINGVDVRVPPEDARDGMAASARLLRFTRELGKTSPGDKVTLRVFADGRYRDVEVTASKSSDLAEPGFMFETRRATPSVRSWPSAPPALAAPQLRSVPSAPPALAAPRVQSAPSAPPAMAAPRVRLAPSAPPALAAPRGIRTVRVRL